MDRNPTNAYTTDEYLNVNRDNWDERTALHLRAYPVDAFRAGESTLKAIELEEVGDVAGRSLLHLQCHIGLDTLSWSRLGAAVTGVDFSPAAIDAARALAGETGIDARFIRSDIDSLPDVLEERFDIVFASYGVLCWIPDVDRWARVAAHFVRPGGFLYLLDGHPINHLLDDDGRCRREGAAYFDPSPERDEHHGSYVGPPTPFAHPVTYQWQHTVGEIVSAIASAGLRIEFVHEWPLSGYAYIEGMVEAEDGYWRLPGDPWPFLLSVKARSSPRPS
jgi:SAM-dependent methyltransferase